jgi:hypothetical protein
MLFYPLVELHSGLRSREQMLEMHTLRAALMEISGDSVQGGTISARMNNIETKVTTLEGATQLNTLAAKKVTTKPHVVTVLRNFLLTDYYS